MSGEQLTFTFDIEQKDEESCMPNRKVTWQSKRVRNRGLQISTDEVVGFEDAALAQRLQTAIASHSNVIPPPIGIEEGTIIAVRRFFQWSWGVDYMVIVALGPNRYVTILSITMYNERAQDADQLLHLDSRCLKWDEKDDRKPWIFRSVPDKTTYLRWCSQGV